MLVIWPKQLYSPQVTSAATDQIPVSNIEQNEKVTNAINTLEKSGSGGNVLAFNSLRRLADEGNRVAQYYLGNILEEGHYGVEKDPKSARQYFKQCIKSSASMNLCDEYWIAAHNDLACSLCRRCDEDYRVANYFQKAAEQNSTVANFNWLCTQFHCGDSNLRRSHIISYLPEQIASGKLSTATYLKLAQQCDKWATDLLEKKLVKFDQDYENNYKLLKHCHQIMAACLKRAEVDIKASAQEVNSIKTKAMAIAQRIPVVEKLKIEGMVAQGDSLHDTYLLARMYMDGDRVKKNTPLALHLFQRVVSTSTKCAVPPSSEELADAYFRIGKLKASESVQAMESAYLQAVKWGNEPAKKY